MDMLMADVTGLDVSPGDEVVIIGVQETDQIDVREMAAQIGTIPYEILCRIGSRIARVYELSSATGKARFHVLEPVEPHDEPQRRAAALRFFHNDEATVGPDIVVAVRRRRRAVRGNRTPPRRFPRET